MQCAPSSSIAVRQRRSALAVLATAALVAACGSATTSRTATTHAPAPAYAALHTTCLAAASRPPPPRALAMAQAALAQHAAWGGATLDAHGRLTRSGAAEAEAGPRDADGLAPWQRVMQYWRAVDPAPEGLPHAVRYGALRPADRAQLQHELAQASSSRLQALAAASDLPITPGLSPGALQALQVAVDRVAVVDTPWSAAFVGWLARQAGLGENEFLFSEAHADYAAAAWEAGASEAAGQSTPYALRACDLARTPPRVGDLVCQTRAGEADLDRFDALAPALAARGTGGGALAMHCDVVARLDESGFDAIGGNVLQTVTLRRLDFAPSTQLLDPSYRASGCTPGSSGCAERNLSRAPWSLLLQWR